MKRTIDLINKLKKKCMNFDIECMKEHNISDSEYNFFLAVPEYEQFNSKLIAKKMNLSLSRVSRIIDKLVNNEFLERENSTIDRRTINIKLSEKGKKIKVKIENYRNECENKIMKNIPPDKLKEIQEAFENIIDIL